MEGEIPEAIIQFTDEDVIISELGKVKNFHYVRRVLVERCRSMNSKKSALHQDLQGSVQQLVDLSGVAGPVRAEPRGRRQLLLSVPQGQGVRQRSGQAPPLLDQIGGQGVLRRGENRRRGQKEENDKPRYRDASCRRPPAF